MESLRSGLSRPDLRSPSASSLRGPEMALTVSSVTRGSRGFLSALSLLRRDGAAKDDQVGWHTARRSADVAAKTIFRPADDFAGLLAAGGCGVAIVSVQGSV